MSTQVKSLHESAPGFGESDYSADFSKFRNQLYNKFGVSYRDFIGGLRPRYGIVFLDIAGAYLALALTLAIVYWVQGSGGWSVLATIIGSVSVGYWLAYLALFVHEGAHYNIAPDRRKNDLLTNLFVGVLTGAIVQRYRIIHWQHHRDLGTTRDTERTYFSALNLRFVLEALSGVKVVRVLLFPDQQLRVGDKESAESPTHLMGYLLFGMAIHTIIVAGAAYLGLWGVLLAWLFGLACFYPFFAALRQLLEHRGETANAAVDYAKQPHGAVTRLFGDGPFSSTFGAAGFNRHLLHHWEPQVSYTNLRKLEEFLMETEVKPILDARRMSYGECFRRLFQPIRPASVL